MASEGRRSVGFADALGDLDGDEWTTKAPEKPRPDPARMRETAERVGFKSREGGKLAPTQAPAAQPRRSRRLTGRREQVNIKATAEFKARFQAIAAKHGWTDAVTFEKAIELLEKEQGA